VGERDGKSVGREEGGKREEKMRGRKEGDKAMLTLHAVIFLSFPIGGDYPRNSTPTLYTHVYFHRWCGCLCSYGQMGIGMGRVYEWIRG
jgi:hypothetical protein